MELKAAGYNAGVVARKLIDQHGVPQAEAEAFVSSLFGKPVNAFAGDTTSAVVSGLVFCVVGVVGAGLVVSMLNADWYLMALPLSLLGFGARRIFFALVNRNVPPGEEDRFVLQMVIALLVSWCACAHYPTESGGPASTAIPAERTCQQLSLEYDGGSCGVSFCSDSTGCSFEGDETRVGTFRPIGDAGQMGRSVVHFNISRSVVCGGSFELCGEHRTCRCAKSR